MLFKETQIIINHIKEDNNFIDFASYKLKGVEGKAIIKVKSDNIVISGINIMKNVLSYFKIKYNFNVNDGDYIKEKCKIGQISGDSYTLLLCERTMLNTLSFMSAIATKTFNLQFKMQYETKIAATRKIIPGTGLLSKLAVMDGGGDTHRLNLSDCIMLKDNHIALYGSIENAISEINKIKSFTKKLEIEVKNYDHAIKATKLDVDIIMLDNFDSEEAKRTAKKIKQINKKVIVEVSGGINKKNYLNYDDNNIDIISMGNLTTEISYIDISMDVE